MDNKKGFSFADDLVSVLEVIIGGAILAGAIILIVMVLRKGEADFARDLLEKIEERYKDLADGEEQTFLVQEFKNAEKWYLIGFSVEQKERPQECFFSNCLCICKLKRGDNAEVIQFYSDIKDSEWSVSNFYKNRAEECDSANAFCMQSDYKFVLQSTINYRNEYGVIVPIFSGGRQSAESPVIPIGISAEDGMVTFDLKMNGIIKNKRGMNQLMMSVVLFIILALFVILLWVFIGQLKNGAAIAEGAYVTEIVKVIDMAKSGDEIAIDVHKATEIAQKNGISDLRESFYLNETGNEICAQLSLGRRSCLSYFNDVGLENFNVIIAPPRNLLKFNVVSKGENDD